MNEFAALELARELQVCRCNCGKEAVTSVAPKAERASTAAAKAELKSYMDSYEAQRAAKAAQRAEQAALDREYMLAQAELLDAMVCVKTGFAEMIC